MKNDSKKTKTISVILFFLFFFTFFAGSASAATFQSDSFLIIDPVIFEGGGRSTSSQFQLLQAVGEEGLGYSTSSLYILESGFLAFPSITSGLQTSGGNGQSGSGGAQAGGGPPYNFLEPSESEQEAGRPTSSSPDVPYEEPLLNEEDEATSGIIETVIEGAQGAVREVAEGIESVIGSIFKKEEEEQKFQEPERGKEIFAKKWKVIDFKKVYRIVNAPLPAPIKEIAVKFPRVQDVLTRAKVRRVFDVDKLRGVQLVLPSVEDFAPSEVPTNFVFARLGHAKIPVRTKVSIVSPETVRKTITAFSGERVEFAVRPEGGAGKVEIDGYLVFLGPTARQKEPRNDFALVKPPFVQKDTPEDLPSELKGKYIVGVFQYKDEDHDGVYTADVKVPESQGEYEVLTRIKYTEISDGNERASKEKVERLTLIADSPGYVYEKFSGREVRIANARVSLYFEETTGNFVLWPAEEYLQKNPQITPQSGAYSFLVPRGRYYIAVTADGYSPYQSEIFDLPEGGAVGKKIRLEPTGWLKVTRLLKGQGIIGALIVFLFFVVLLHLYRDFKRDRMIKK